LVWWFVLMILSTEKVKKLGLVKHEEYVAFLAALIFCVHPVQTQAVSYISQRAASLATLFYLLSVCLYVKGRLTKNKLVVSVACFMGSIISGLLGMFTKEIVITLPLSIVLFEYFFLWKQREKPFSAKEKSVFILSAIALLSFMFVIPYIFKMGIVNMLFGAKPSQSHQGDIITFWKYEFTQLRVLSLFIKLLFVPLGQNFDYDFVLSKSLFELKTFLCFIFVILVGVFAVKSKKKNMLVSYGMFWIFVTYSANLIPRANVIFEHKLYLISIGFCLALSAGLYYMLKDLKKFVWVMVAIAIVLSFLTYKRNKVWGNEFLFWSDVVKKSPNKARPHNDLGLAYFKNGDYASALEHYHRAIELDATIEEAYNNRGVVYTKRGQDEFALDDFNKAISIRPRYADALNNRGVIYKRKGMFDMALRDYIEALRYNMVYPDIFFNIAVIYEKKGRLDLAERNYNKALSLDRYKADAYNNRAIVYSKTKRLDEALKGFEKAISLKSDYFEAYNNKGSLLFLKGDYDGAIKNYGKAIEINPGYYDAYKNRAFVYSRSNNVDLAIGDYSETILLRPNDPELYYSRSMLYGRQGNFNKALEDVMKAKHMGLEIKDEYIQEIKERLKNASSRSSDQ
ncbi:MAG: tetratricopeptide repeat protein, partial [Candidatus Omnitrophica bacterium]|nr:tetratricopeptide repeat protein [Candidatus Omnitrophota bacterium]